jgi:transcription-repair coupling factor (superfamily II helicase)
VGFDLYNQLLQEAVLELKGERPPEKAEAPSWELPLDTYLPDSYVGAGQKVEIYRRLALALSPQEVQELEAELRDRFGPLPQPVSYLLRLTELRCLAREQAIAEVQFKGNSLAVRFSREASPGPWQLERWGRVFGKRISFSAVGDLQVNIRTKGLEPEKLVQMLKQVLEPQPS